ncbi:hypothetical protein RR48_07275 [Papilio machaon]|uniref:Uncharacterized protein n=1 Tax=Papilio machaon TaxID=76193 RepID=A0A194RR84_PAPMA|nr:hypothetical protein RR48_07275 [Papilio machaon]
MGAVDFMLGPLGEEDHGNWILSVLIDLNKEATEVFQIITIEIIEKVPIEPQYPKLTEGSNFILKFAYPIKYLESCELKGPKTLSDRYYNRTGNNVDSCEFIVTNITREDQEWWYIIGVGKIVYETKVYLKVINKKT